MAALIARLQSGARSPWLWIGVVAIALRAAGFGWGLPASDGWDNDGIAPRDFWPGLIETFTPGHYFTYPPAHLALLALVTAPITATILLRAPSLTATGVLSEALKVPYMTSYSIVARLLSAAMSMGIAYAIGTIAEEIGGRRAGWAAAAVCVGMITLTYYSHTTNLDVPYLFWSALALLALTRAVSRAEPGQLRRVGVFAAIATASKDQAYAIFLLGAPLSLLYAVATGAFPKARLGALARELARSVALGAAILLLVDGAVFNPTGFAARMRFLFGPASDPFAYYTPDLRGRFFALTDTFRHFEQHYPLVVAPLMAAGVVRILALRGSRERAAALVPLWAALSFTLLFNCVARRTEQRFLLPQMTIWAAYGGLGIDWLLGVRPAIARAAAEGACAIALGWSLWRCADVDANLILDPRYDAEAWLHENVAPGDLVEVHGKSVYLPRMPPQARVVRVGPDPADRRNPLFGAEERRDAFGNIAARAPRWIVVNETSARPYLAHASRRPAATGRVPAGTEVQASSDDDATSFFRALLAGQLGYRRVHVSTWTSSFWERMDIHGSIAPEIWVFERG